jgi:hypothetical protein
MNTITTPTYVVWSIEHDAWWRPAREGYTRFVEEAGVYSADDSADIVSKANYPPGTFHECRIPLMCVGRI